MKLFFLKMLSWLYLITFTCVLAACASTNGKLAWHSFGFDAVHDSPDIEILDFKYGNSKNKGTKNPDWVAAKGTSVQGTGTGGEILVGDFLYVKWRIKSTGEVYQDNVDLKSRLPANIEDHTVYFVVKASQLYVYLVTPERRPLNMPPSDLRLYKDRIVKTLYPDQPKSKS
jgi:hypothetical protein